MRSDLLLPRSTRVESSKEFPSGLVQRVKREESACKQPSFSRRREVKTPAITKTSPLDENSVIRARGMLLTRSDCTPTLLCLQGGVGEFSLSKGRIFERMCQVASTEVKTLSPSKLHPRKLRLEARLNWIGTCHAIFSAEVNSRTRYKITFSATLWSGS